MTLRTSAATLLLGALLGAGATVVGLAQAGALEPARPEALVSLAQLVDAEHRRVDLLLKQGDTAGAIAALEELRNIAWPNRAQGGDEAVILRHDVYGRLLRLRLDNDAPSKDGATVLLEIGDEGLGEDSEAVDINPFTARLVALRGECLENLDRDGDALSAYEKALDMNGTLLERELAETP